MSSLAISLQLLFVLYYAYVLYVFYKLHENSCNCKKLSKFNKTWNFYYVVFVSSILLILNLNQLIKIISNVQVGGSSNDILYRNTLILLNLGFGVSFLNDYAILDLFRIMQKQECPCHIKHRMYLKNMTYVKLGMNVIYYIYMLQFLNKKTIMLIAKKLKKQQNK